MRPLADEYFQEQLEAKNEQLYQKHTELLKLKAILASTETELRGADLLIAKLKAQVAAMECALRETQK
jgi:N-methylhydantoinase B/oxoprolinase/acetone carboxylase alpha subunit